MSKHSIFAVVIGVAALTAPGASEAHCLHFNKMRANVVGAFDGTMRFTTGVAYRTQKFGDRMLGWMRCGTRI